MYSVADWCPIQGIYPAHRATMTLTGIKWLLKLREPVCLYYTSV